MKNINSILGIFLLFWITSCQEDKIMPDYCFKIVHENPDSIILAEEELDTIIQLFEMNNLNYSNYQFFKFKIDEYGNYHIRCYQYINSIRIFFDDLFFHYNSDGKLSSIGGDIITEITLSNHGSMNPNYVIDIFLNELDQDKNFFHDKNEIQQGCFDVELGYYDLNSTGANYLNRNFTRVWKVKPEAKSVPYCLINDLNGKIVLYDNGYRFK